MKGMNGEPRGHRIVYDVPVYGNYQTPNGYLVPEPACHALWHYYLIARLNYEQETDGMVYEGDPDPIYNYHQLFKSIAQWFGVEPEHMAKYWPNIDAQAKKISTPLLPNEEKYRFNRPAVIITGV